MMIWILMMKSHSNMKEIRRKNKYAETSGIQDPKLDTFRDVDRALRDFLLKNNAEFLKNSNATKARHLARQGKNTKKK